MKMMLMIELVLGLTPNQAMRQDPGDRPYVCVKQGSGSYQDH